MKSPLAVVRDLPLQIGAYIKTRLSRRSRVKGYRIDPPCAPDRRDMVRQAVAAIALIAAGDVAGAGQAQAAFAQIQALLDSSMVGVAGSTAPQSLRNSFEVLLTPEWFGATGDGTHDDSDAINLAFTSGHKLLNLRADKRYYCGKNLSIPAYATVVGTIGALELTTIASYAAIGSQLTLGSGVTINMAEGSLLRQVLITRAGITMPAATYSAATAAIASFSGTAVTYQGADCLCEDLVILGFATAILSNSASSPTNAPYTRPKARRIRFDCTSGINFIGGGDIGEISQCQGYPYATLDAPDNTGSVLRRSGIAYRYAADCDWSWGFGNFTYGHAIGYQRDGCSNVRWINCQADYTAPNTGSVCGFSNINSVTSPMDIGCTAIAQANAIIHSPTGASGQGGLLKIIGGIYNSSVENIVVNGGGVNLTSSLFGSGTCAVRFGASAGYSQIGDCYLTNLVQDFVFDATAVAQNVSILNIMRDGVVTTNVTDQILARLTLAPLQGVQGILTIQDSRLITGGNGGAINFTTGLFTGIETQASIRASLLNATSGSEASQLVFATQGAGTLADRWAITDGGALTPVTDSVSDLGSSSARARVLYVGKVNTSIVRIVPTEGGSYSVNGAISKILLDPSGNLNSIQLTFEADSVSVAGDEFEVMTTKAISTINLYQGGGTNIYTLNNIAAGRKVTIWNIAGTFYAGVN